ncbi:MAG TPA: hypothetical protein PLF92_08595 [Arenimonas sp.]|nr:hypothetical protein [Arenimonas sp.]HPW32953.1 hypothetical protein [Arenimonas sp.]
MLSILSRGFWVVAQALSMHISKAEESPKNRDFAGNKVIVWG